MIVFAVCDDEPFMLDDVVSRLSKYAEERHIEHKILRFDSGKALLESKQAYDILFLDIQMEQPDGMKTAKYLRQRGFQGLLIFITILKDNVFDSFEAEPYDYLLKPLDEVRFRRTLDRARNTLLQEDVHTLTIRKGNTCQVIPFSQLIYCEVLGRKIYLHQQGGGTIDFYEKFDNLEKQMDSRFFRCHRSYLVNLDYVRGCRDGRVQLSEGGDIPVSRLREQGLAQALLLHMKERRQYRGLV
ncbi:LytR/AlgR family response regulator transcription factor [Dorea sp. D27]|uniref:LytR/AlgR family response regulator transcription factor n=1 Tax=Dorea sp. D27 TaxID=658665 RepID=UPI00067345B8|nr:LytTR family DNA-binding domain-containing protein [Dorea sp. D27]KMZ53110.1 putative DNA-binding response regulator, LytTr family [Dorea sp. D27]